MARWRRALDADGGFTLIEMVVAITLAALILTGGAAVLSNTLRAIVQARANSQSAELVSEKLEQIRALEYAAIAMDPDDLAGDADIGGTSSAPTTDPDGSGPLADEALVVADGGAVSPHVVDVTRNAQTYTLATYVTVPPTDSEVGMAAYKRVTVRATWNSGGLTHSRQSSTYVTRTRRGLPLPNFQVTATEGVTSAISVNAGAQLVLPFTVVNRGARDTFNLSITSAPSLGSTFDLYYDTGGSGTYEASGTDADVPAEDADADGTPDTDEMSTDATLPMVAVTTVPGTAIAGSYIMTLTATSAGQPDATGATRTATFDVTVVNQSACSGCTYTALYLLNEYPACATAPCNTTARTNMPMRPSSSPTAASLPNFDTNVDSVEGRSVANAVTTPLFNSTTSSTMANWRYTVPSNTTLKGGANAIIDIYVAAQTAGLPLTITAYVNHSPAGTTSVNDGSGSATLNPVLSGFQHVQISVPIVANTTVNNNRFIEVKLVVNSTLSTTGAHFAYDAFAYPSVLWIPVV